MPDREKVIEAVKTAFDVWIDEYTGCSSFKEDEVRKAKEDALALLKEQGNLGTELTNAVELIHKKNERIEKLLKEQEAVEPEVEVLNEIDRIYRCPRCHKHFFYEKQRFCDQCGQAVKL